MTAAPAIQFCQINKAFGDVIANRNVDMLIRGGTIHGIVGENGAGKSTLMSILYGFYRADSGDILVDGQPTAIGDSKTALSLGIGMVHQHFMLIENFTVLENVVLGAERDFRLKGALSRARIELKRLADNYGLSVDPNALIADLPVGHRQRVEILKALFRGANTLILDEPTGVLTPGEADELFRILEVLREEGKTVILITHKLREIMAITETVSVMRRGEVVAERMTRETSPAELAELMVGRRLPGITQKQRRPGDQEILRVEGLTIAGRHSGAETERPALDNVSFSLHRGEILGIAGVSGNGQSELLETLAGIRSARSGGLRIGGQRIDPTKRGTGAGRMRELGLAHVPEDRHMMGLVNSFPVYENIILGRHRERDLYRHHYLKVNRARARASAHIAKYDVRPPDCMLQTGKLSGGNQQKLVLSREIEVDPDILLVGQPTRGVDIGAIEFIHQRLLALRDLGKAILLVSVELDEIRALSDRILVMFDGQIMGECTPDASERDIGLMMTGMRGTPS